MRSCRIARWHALLALPWLLALPASGAVLRVVSGATNAAPDGLSWTTAFPGVTNALTIAQFGDEIWVAAGTYPGGLTLPDGIALYGGFAGTEETRAQRNFAANVTTLDAQRLTNIVTIAPGAGPDTRVDGFTIRNGHASGSGSEGSGGGLRAVNADPVVANNQFLSNTTVRFGSAVYLESSSAVLLSNYFGFNGTGAGGPRDGGAVAVVRSSPRLEGNSFVGNRGRDGGAVHFSASSGFLIGNSMLNNTATRDGGAVMCVSASPQITHNRLLGNTAASLGGGVSLTAGSASLLFNNVIVRNSAATGTAEPSGGGGVFVDGTSQPNVLNNTLVLNTAPVGGLLVSNRNAIIANNLVAFGSSGIGGVSSLNLQTNNVFGNGSNYVGINDVTGTAGNISADPRFGGDIRLGVVNILPESPCRDAGNSALVPVGASDIDGQPRLQGSAVDLGADETDGVSTYFLPAVVRVAPDGDDNNDGFGWATPKRTVQAAIELAGWRGGEVWVLKGTYVENLVLRPFTSLFAGFAGGETNRNERNWRANETILDGNRASNVLQLPNLNFDETVDGFTIRHGSAAAGGGVYAEGNVRIQNNHFLANEATPVALATQARGGGGLYLNGGNAVVANNRFVRNRVASTNRTLSAEGGAIKIASGVPTIINNLFRKNSVTNSFALGEARGGALVVVGNARPTVSNNTFLQNTATALSGTATQEQGGAVSFAGTVSDLSPLPLLVNNLIAYNSSGVTVSGRVPGIFNNLVWGNIRTNYDRIADPTGSGGNLSLPPKLTGPYGDPHLTAESPARDAGDDTVVQADWLDLDGMSRLVGETVDIGADEFDGTVHEIADRVFYVATDGDDSRAGTSWTTAKKTVAAALAEAALDGGEVWVKSGVYLERVRVELFTYLFGGFKGDEISRTARNWSAQPSVLDGGADPANPVAGASVVTVIGTDGYATVDGFTIQNGAARAGGGLNVFGSALVAHNIIRSNIAVTVSAALPATGGGLYCNAGEPTIVNNVFVGNSTFPSSSLSSRGGAIFLNTPPGEVPAVLQNTLLDNRAASGGGLFLGTATDARIANNIVAFGSSGLAATNTTHVASFNCVFGNTASDYAGISAGPGSVSADPLLVDWRQGNYRLRADSPCINAGDMSVLSGALDVFAEPRLAESGPELGADEFSGPAAADFSLALSQPLGGSVFAAPATVFVSVAITGGTTPPVYVEYLANGELLTVGTNAPFSSFAEELIAGDYSIVARAIVANGALATSAPVAITVVIPPGNVPPTLTFSAPTNGQEFRAPANVRTVFRWVKPGGRVIRWELFVNGSFVATDPKVPVGVTSATNIVPNLLIGNHVLTAIATDAAGAKGTNEVSFVVRRGDPLPSVAVPPQLLPDGSVRLAFSTPSPEADYVLESTGDLTSWIPVSTNRGGPSLEFIIPLDDLRPFEAFRTRAVYP